MDGGSSLATITLLNKSAKDLIDDYNRNPRYQRYNRVAEKVYQARRRLGPYVPEFETHIIDGLKGFGMARKMTDGFPIRLHRCLETVRTQLLTDRFHECSMSSVDLLTHGSTVLSVYNNLANPGNLNDQSHVATTKILHWLFPDLFLIVDSNVARFFRTRGYSANIYLNCLEIAQHEICSFGAHRFRQLEPHTPEARIFDKIAFIIGHKKPCPTSLPLTSPPGATVEGLVRPAGTFWHMIADLRDRNVIPKRWSIRDIRPHLLHAFKPRNINTVPANQSNTRDGSVKGDYVKRGSSPKAFRVDRGLFELIDDPSKS